MLHFLIVNINLEYLITFVADNEGSLHRVIVIILPLLNNLLCFLHILQNVK